MSNNKKLKEIDKALTKNGPEEAFKLLRPIVDYPGHLEKGDQWEGVFGVFSRIAAAMENEDLAGSAQQAANNSTHPKALYNLGYQLIENKLYGFAATVLSLADNLAPGNESIVTELVCAFEHIGINAEACNRLRSSGLVESSWLCKYLLAFHSIMSADLPEAQKLLPELRSSTSLYHKMLQTVTKKKDISVDEKINMANRIEGMLKRADAVQKVTPLDNHDLRGWHFVLNGAFLLHLSPDDFEGVNGRYAYTQDSDERCLEGIRRLALVLNAMKVRPQQIFILNDRDSTILGHAVAQIMGLPITQWSCDADGNNAPRDAGLIVAYDLANLDRATLISLYHHRPGQILFAHATCWTDVFPSFTADLTTYLYQTNASPWGQQMFIDVKTMKVQYKDRLDSPIETLVSELTTTKIEDHQLLADDISALGQLASAASLLTKESAPGIMLKTGSRRRLWECSPVKSSRFI